MFVSFPLFCDSRHNIITHRQPIYEKPLLASIPSPSWLYRKTHPGERYIPDAKYIFHSYFYDQKLRIHFTTEYFDGKCEENTRREVKVNHLLWCGECLICIWNGKTPSTEGYDGDDDAKRAFGWRASEAVVVCSIVKHCLWEACRVSAVRLLVCLSVENKFYLEEDDI